MEFKNSKEKEVVIDIDSGSKDQTTTYHHGASTSADNNNNKWGKKSLNKLVSGVLGLNVSSNIDSDVINSHETMELLDDNNNQGGHLLPLIDNINNNKNNVDLDKERPKAGKPSKNSGKPPRPPRGPSLDAADMRLIKEISKVAMKKRERIERMKAVKKMKAARMTSQSSSSSSGGTISAMFITILFFLVVIFQGFGCSSSSKSILMGAPTPAPETTGLSPLQFYENVLSDDGADARDFVSPKSTKQVSGSELSSLG